MNALILAAGYATRLYPLTIDRPKPLLPVGGRPIIDYLLDEVESVPGLREIFVVSNHRFADRFRDWAASGRRTKPVHILDDGSNAPDERLGAIGDIAWAIEATGISGELLVSAADNLFPFRFRDFADFAASKGADCITCHRRPGVERLRRTAIIERAPDGRVVRFEEKPKEPWSDLAVPPVYLYRGETLPLFAQYLAEGNNPDAPGHFVPWLLARRPVYAFLFDAEVIDVGDLQSYQAACAAFSAGRGGSKGVRRP
ncbi:MAG: nucleotidyltransferase family protein [Armatimonadota bacterium]|nr:nucleotidyltransferase family protein [Armatimonadota bacterium]